MPFVSPRFPPLVLPAKIITGAVTVATAVAVAVAAEVVSIQPDRYYKTYLFLVGNESRWRPVTCDEIF